MYIKTTCNKCGAEFHLDLGEMSRGMAEKAFRKLDSTSRQCPGHHVELGGWYSLWNLEDALHRAYDLGEAEEFQVPTDEEHVRELIAKGMDIVDGGSNTVPNLNMSSIHDEPNLKHIGFGNFTNESHLFTRCDSPTGTRFYQRVAKESAHAM